MATSSFTQNFKVTKKQSDAFVKLFKNPASPTLNRDFESRILKSSDKQSKEKIERAFMR